MAARSTNTYAEGLQSVLAQLAQLMTLPDANIEFCKQMQDAVIGELRAPVTRMMDAGLLPPDGPAGAPMAMAGPAGPPPGGGFMPGPGMPPTDELRRLLSVEAS